MKMIKLLSALLFISFAITSCNDDDSDINKPKDVNYSDLINKKFILVSAISEHPLDTNNDGISDRDIFKQMLPCEVDNIYEFYDNERFILDENSNICQGKSQTITGRWAKNGTTGIIMYDQNGKELEIFQDVILKKENNKMIMLYYRYWNINNNIIKVEYKLQQK